MAKKNDDLPPGWEKKYDFATKKTFYVDNINKITTWDHPKKFIAELKNSEKKIEIQLNELNLAEKSITQKAIPKIVSTSFNTDENVLDEIDKILKYNLESNNSLELMKERKDADLESDDYSIRRLEMLKSRNTEFDEAKIKEALNLSFGNYSSADYLLNSIREKNAREQKKRDDDIKAKLNAAHNQTATAIGNKTAAAANPSYKPAERSIPMIKAILRSEFHLIDMRIVDRVLMANKNSMEKAREELKKLLPLKKENGKQHEKKFDEKTQSGSSDSEKDDPDPLSFDFENIFSNEKLKKEKNWIGSNPSLAKGPNPSLVKGAQINYRNGPNNDFRSISIDE